MSPRPYVSRHVPASGIPAEPADGPDIFLTLRELQEFLHVSRSTAWRLTRRRHDPLPLIAWGAGALRFSREEVTRWLYAQRRFRTVAREVPRSPGRPRKVATAAGGCV